MNDDGGPAFPVPISPTHYCPTGMSLRDWFAGQALVGGMAREASPHNPSGCSSPIALAVEAYNIADAMLAIRQQPTEDGK